MGSANARCFMPPSVSGRLKFPPLSEKDRELWGSGNLDDNMPMITRRAVE